jgi:ATP-dependent Zn protease
MDAKAKEMVDEAYERTLQLLTTRKEELVKVAELLMLKVRACDTMGEVKKDLLHPHLTPSPATRFRLP